MQTKPPVLVISAKDAPNFEPFGPSEERNTVPNFMAREAAESDTRYRQIIPYILIQDTRNPEDLFVYIRKEGESDQRLTGKVSIGVGGHIEEQDGDWQRAFVRELEEETGLVRDISEARYLGMILGNETEVDRVHLGLVLLVNAIKEDIKPGVELAQPGWLDFNEIMRNLMIPKAHNPLETWGAAALALLSPQQFEAGLQQYPNIPGEKFALTLAEGGFVMGERTQLIQPRARS